MRLNRLLVLPLLMLVGLPFAHGAQSAPAAVPSAVIRETRFEFPKALEGKEVTHDFIVENRGAAPLVIEEVKTG